MKKITPSKAAYLATAIAVELAEGKSIIEINAIKAFVSQISSALQTICAQEGYIDFCKNNVK